MQGKRAEAGAQVGPPGPRLLHIILAKDPVTGLQNREDPFWWLNLGDGDQRGAAWRATGGGKGGGHAGLDVFKRHRRALFALLRER